MKLEPLMEKITAEALRDIAKEIIRKAVAKGILLDLMLAEVDKVDVASIYDRIMKGIITEVKQ